MPNVTSDPVSQWLMFGIALIGIIVLNNVLTSPKKESKKEVLRRKMWAEYNRISSRIQGAPNLAGLVGLNDEILDMLNDFRRVNNICQYTGVLHAKLKNREGEVRRIKQKRIV